MRKVTTDLKRAGILAGIQTAEYFSNCRAGIVIKLKPFMAQLSMMPILNHHF
jgi:hypothetical protein